MNQIVTRKSLTPLDSIKADMTQTKTKTMSYDRAMEIALAGGTVRRLSWGNPYCTVKVNPALLASGFDKYDLTDELTERFLENFEADLIATDWVEVKS